MPRSLFVGPRVGRGGAPLEQVWASETLRPWKPNDSLLVSCREYGPGGAYEFWSLGQPKVEIENLCHELQLED